MPLKFQSRKLQSKHTKLTTTTLPPAKKIK